ncbi:MAG TPA: protein kinase, partial [Polyangiaceae bacterium]
MRWPPLEPEAEARPGSGDVAAEPTPTPPIQLGALVADKYRVDRVIGFGGMGVVCAATHVELGTPVAIKFVRQERDSDERAVSRTLTEARSAAQLLSQHSCRVMDCGRLPSGSPYIVMEYLVGRDLRSLLETRGLLPIEEAVSLALQACEALAEAHVKGIVHRDIKPENLFLAEGPGGAPLLKVLDFGISKQLSPLMAPSSFTDSAEHMGSPFHMSPEQMTDPAGVDSRTDIWSLGVALYELLTGQLPFGGQSGPQLCANVMTAPPIPPQAHCAEIPDGLARVILRCLEKDRELRYRDVGELGMALREFGGPAAAIAVARVERIFGRTEPPAAAFAADLPDAVEASPSSQAIDSIPGVPRRGFGLRVSVTLVLLLASGLCVYAARRAWVSPPIDEHEHEHEPALPAAAPLPEPVPTPSALAPEPVLPSPSAARPVAAAKRPRQPASGAPGRQRAIAPPLATKATPAPAPDGATVTPEDPLSAPQAPPSSPEPA